MLYNYKIKKVLKILDGDTIDVEIDLGFDIYVKRRVRFYGIDAPKREHATLRRKQGERIQGIFERFDRK